ncbi:MAG: hypothetical protein FWG80_03380 [Alphaproteobacteria bacterium]|nr:hypothetical protein [Alphaproteobacteria bacterium]
MLQTSLKDNTVSRAYIKQILNIAKEYELVKINKHPHFKFVSDLFRVHKIPKQTFHKIYSRLKTAGTPIPGKRGPKNPQHRFPAITNAIIKSRQAGLGILCRFRTNYFNDFIELAKNIKAFKSKLDIYPNPPIPVY